LKNAYKTGDKYDGKYVFQSREGVTEVLRIFYSDLIREASSSFCTELQLLFSEEKPPLD